MTKFVSYVPDEAIEKDAQALLAEYEQIVLQDYFDDGSGKPTTRGPYSRASCHGASTGV
jgi:hypothetical protein